MSTSARAIITASYGDLGVIATPAELTAYQADDALLRLNGLVNSLAAQTQSMPFIARQVFPVVANQATYTMGPGGDFNTSRPEGLTGAGLLLNSSNPPVEIPRGLLTDDGYEAIQIKDLTNTLWTNVYFNATYAGGWATVTLWPVPTTSQNDCVLYRRDIIQGFATLDTAYDFPYGYAEMFQYNLDLRLARPNGVPLAAIGDLVQMAQQSLGIIKRANYTLTDLPTDPALTRNIRGGYDINTGQGGGAYS